MKLLFRNIFFLLAIAGFISCEPEEEAKPKLENPPAEDQLSFSITRDAQNDNIVHARNTSQVGFKNFWTVDGGEPVYADSITQSFALAGTYNITLTVINGGGKTSMTREVTIEEDDPTLLDFPRYNLLTGGPDQLEGKTWVIDSTQSGHLGVGPATSMSPDYYKAAPTEKAGQGYYNDEFTFKLADFAYEYDAKGDVFANVAHADAFPGVSDPAADFTAPFTPSENLSWSLSEPNADGIMTLSISNGGHIGYYSGGSTYEVLKLDSTEMYIRSVDSKDGNLYWYQRLIPKGYSEPEPPTPYKIEDIQDNFDESGTVTWFKEEVLTFNESYDNPATFGINTSQKVAKYEKGAGDEHLYDNVQINLEYKMDITQRNKFTMKVFMPSYNDYTTEDALEWSPFQSLTPVVALKLQNSEMSEPWRTQAQVIDTVETLDQWTELSFDFSEWKDREDFDRVILQIGGEAHRNPGTFFVDDFMLLPAE